MGLFNKWNIEVKDTTLPVQDIGQEPSTNDGGSNKQSTSSITTNSKPKIEENAKSQVQQPANQEVNPPKEDTPKPVQPVPEPPKVDPEYEALKKIAVFKTYEECDSMTDIVGLEYSNKENSNFRNTVCSSVAYNGELLGYSLKIYFMDSTFEYYK